MPKTKRKLNEEKVLEYEDAPSGSVVFYNYKEPLMRFKEGHGFIGALIFDTDTKKIQCHICGKWFDVLANHLAREHNMSSASYKDIVGLNQSTALINETVREKLIATGMEKRLKNLKNRKGTTVSEETKNKIRETLKKNKAEMQNLHNTCPAQLLERLRNEFIKIGHTPSEKTLNFKEALLNTYGTYREACRLAGIPEPLKPGQTHRKPLYTKEKCVEYIRNYIDVHQKLPTYKLVVEDGAKGLWNKIVNSFDKKEIFKEAIGGDGRYRKTEFKMRYSNEELIEFLISFEKVNKRKPSYSDCRRNLLPPLSTYVTRFKGWNNALKQAFPVV